MPPSGNLSESGSTLTVSGAGSVRIAAGRNRFGSFAEGKYTAPNSLYTNIFHYPCPYETTNKSGACIVVEGDARPLPTES